MGHLGNMKQEYYELSKRLDKNVVGFPEPENEKARKGWLTILELLYTKEEAMIGSLLPTFPASLETIAKRKDISKEKLKEIISVSNCFCRHKAEHLDKRCSAPMETCLSLDDFGRFVIRRNFGREISKKEAIEILKDCRKHHLVHLVDNVKNKPAWICNCCKCCCGVCASACPQNDITLERREKINFVPDSKIELLMLRAFERNKLAEFVYDNGEQYGTSFLDLVVKVISTLPQKDQDKALNQLDSKFVNYMVKHKDYSY